MYDSGLFSLWARVVSCECIITAKAVQQIKTAVTITVLFVLSSATDITSPCISVLS